MKFKTTKKAMKEKYYRILSVPYCELQSLLNYEKPIAYSSGGYGWSCDYYYIDGVLISTGYGTLDSKNVTCNYDMMHEYEKQARELTHISGMPEVRKGEVSELLHRFISEIKGDVE